MQAHDSLAIVQHQIGAHLFQLLPEKALYWPAQRTLILGDLHLGKATHFNKAGISIPQREVEAKNFNCLEGLLQQHLPQRVFFLGDLFHSEHNSIWTKFIAALQPWTNCEFVLIEGNHDILEKEKYSAAGLNVVPQWEEEGLLFTHEPLEYLSNDQYNIAGHLHPGVRLIGKGRQSMRLPCFFFGSQQAIMPAFGSFTGLMLMKPKKQDDVFVIYDGLVQKV